MRKLSFYFCLIALVILDSFLLSKPNLLGKIGLIIYKYHYLRTFPRTLLTVSIVVVIAFALAELISFLVKRRTLKRVLGTVVLVLLIAVSFATLVKTGMDFSTWTYSHTGLRFRFGAYLLPTLLIVLFTYALVRLPKPDEVFPESPVNPGVAANKDITPMP
ncbi:hypothetical protein [Chryseolinea soli]|uniref:Uncharacterized protein n=1 Tax=Chryseolinea soli TaxID=2321403 RepID=A0A385SKJ2_9BACT|nr:hypothetical protein [Chryseolinea soli]AYB32283.1 hypothetical protein D4L85_17645 [Chryseolinea soli]